MYVSYLKLWNGFNLEFRVFWDVLPCKLIVIRDDDDGSSTYLWNVGRQLFYTAVHPRRQFWTRSGLLVDCFFSIMRELSIIHLYLVDRQWIRGILFGSTEKFTRGSQEKRPDSWREKWMLHHDNAPAHASLLIREFLAKNETTVVPQPPYSPDLAPADFFLFPKLKSTLKGRRFESTEENSLTELRAIPKK